MNKNKTLRPRSCNWKLKIEIWRKERKRGWTHLSRRGDWELTGVILKIWESGLAMVRELQWQRWGGWWIGQSLGMRMMGVGEGWEFVEDESRLSTVYESWELRAWENRVCPLLLCYLYKALGRVFIMPRAAFLKAAIVKNKIKKKKKRNMRKTYGCVF